MAGAIEGTFLVDAHVHCHPCFAPPEFLDHARLSCVDAARDLGIAGKAVLWLLFAALPDDHYLDELKKRRIDCAKWRLEPTAEAASVVARHGDGQIVVLVAGRQMTTAEGLEVLALGSTAAFADHRSLPATVAAVRAEGALAVIPWGFGKWWGRRGRVVAEFLGSVEQEGFFLGDNGGRPAGMPAPPQFREAARRGIFVLPGSDPLPLPTEAQRVARYGFVLEGAVDAERPAEGLVRLLGSLNAQPPTFGRLPPLGPCLARQLKMQWRKHWRSR